MQIRLLVSFKASFATITCVQCHIQIAPHWDHSLVLLELKTNVQPLGGPGFWKFNCSLLADCDYTEKMARKIPQFIESYEYLDDKGLLWEMVKNGNKVFYNQLCENEG